MTDVVEPAFLSYEKHELNFNSTYSNSNLLLDQCQFKQLFDPHPDLILILNIEGQILNVNQSVIRIFGDLSLKKNHQQKYFDHHSWLERDKYFQRALNGVSQNYKVKIHDKYNQKLDLDVTYVPIFNIDMKVAGVYVHAKDTTIRYDYLTGLPNRRMFEDKIEALIQSSKQGEKVFSVLYLDLDRFKTINDMLGNEAANNLIQQFSLRLKRMLHHSNFLARLCGDEFGIVLSDYQQKELPETIAQAIIASMKEPFMVGDYEIYITASIGITTFSSGDTLDEVLKHTTAALSRAKKLGKNNYQIYSPSLKIESYKRYNLEKDMHKALKHGQFFLEFQPRVEATTGIIKSAEALIRWQHPVWGLVSPKEFIHLAEENGLIIEIGDWVLQQVCQYLKKWKQKKLKVVPISINISAQRFLRGDWINYVKDTLKDTGADPTLIEIEITERTLILHEKGVSTTIHCLKEMGIKVALDDFGTGYSSLSHLTRYPIDTIKIDPYFISNIDKNHSYKAIVKAAIFMAEELKKNIVAEGVETVEQLSFLKQHGCKEIQRILI